MKLMLMPQLAALKMTKRYITNTEMAPVDVIYKVVSGVNNKGGNCECGYGENAFMFSHKLITYPSILLHSPRELK